MQNVEENENRRLRDAWNFYKVLLFTISAFIEYTNCAFRDISYTIVEA